MKRKKGGNTMSEIILQINYAFSGTRDEYEAANLPYAAPIAETPGMRWKIWLMDEANHEGGGIYLFEDAVSVQAFLDGPIVAEVRENPSLSNVSIKQFDALEAHSIVTRGLQKRPRTFGDMAAEALAAVPVLTPAEAQRRLRADPNTLVIDAREAADIAYMDTVPGAINITYGALTYQADHEVPEEWRAPQLADRSRPIITTCILGPVGALAGKLLKDMGFSHVSILEGGVQAWLDAGLPTMPFGSGTLAA
jgi:rhodanese-related sulfurtransferase